MEMGYQKLSVIITHYHLIHSQTVKNVIIIMLIIIKQYINNSNNRECNLKKKTDYIMKIPLQRLNLPIYITSLLLKRLRTHYTYKVRLVSSSLFFLRFLFLFGEGIDQHSTDV